MFLRTPARLGLNPSSARNKQPGGRFHPNNIMAKDETKRMRPVILQEDRDAFAAIKAMSDYAPANKTYTTDKLQALQDAVVQKREIEVQKQAEADAARDETVAAEWAFHNGMLAAKDQVKAQYGDDS